MDKRTTYTLAMLLTCGALTGAACSPAPAGSSSIDNSATTGSEGTPTSPGATGAPGTTGSPNGPTGTAGGSPPSSGGSPPPGGAGGSPGKSPPPPGECAIASTGDWSGSASFFNAGTAGGPTIVANVRWTLAASEGCVDRYVPTGTAGFDTTAGVCTIVVDPPSAAVNPVTDGQLIIDRTTSPATYVMEGKTTWNASVGCFNEVPDQGTIGGVWASHHGTFDGSVISGVIDNPHLVAGIAEKTIWRFTRVDAVFTPPAPGACSEPATDHWSGTALVSTSGTVGALGTSMSTDLVWTRVSTTGCVDHFEPAGTATYASNFCTGITPTSHAIAPSDGSLEIDRSFDPPRFTMTGDSRWDATQTCPDGSGGTTTQTSQIGGPWALYSGVFDGNAFSASSMFQFYPLFQWSLTRMP